MTKQEFAQLAAQGVILLDGATGIPALRKFDPVAPSRRISPCAASWAHSGFVIIC